MPEKRTVRVGFEGEISNLDIQVPETEPEIWGADAKLRVVGTSVPRIDGLVKATGAAQYTADVRLPGMLHARMFRAAVPGGDLKSLDLDAARKAPGVRLVRAVRNVGDPLLFDGVDLALVVADSEAQAEDALALCRYEQTGGAVCVTEEDALADGAPPVIPGSRDNQRGGGPRESGGRTEVAFLRAEKAIADADVVLEKTYRTRVQTHSALEPHGLVVRPDEDGGVTVWASTQGTFSVRGGICQALNLRPNQVRVITEFMGGGFGAKFGPSAQGSGFGVEVARAAMELKVPVRCMLTRREEHLVGGNRPSSIQKVKIGLKKDGKVLSYTVVSRGTAGCVEGGAGVANPNVYDLGATAKQEITVVTHTGPAAAFRAPARPQGSFALESMMDEAAEAIGMDPLEFRLRLDSNPVRQAQWKDAAKKFKWSEARRVKPGAGKGPLKRGVGCGAAIWHQSGGDRDSVQVTAHRDGTIEVFNGAQDIGTGTRTVLAIVVAEVLGVPVEAITVNLGQTRWPSGPGSGGSTTAPTLAPCARDAAEKARAAILGKRPADGLPAWKAACARMDAEQQTFEGRRPATYGMYRDHVAGVQFVEVEADEETGVVRVTRVLALQDCGRVVSRLTAESQVMGAVINGISYALFEERKLDRLTGRFLHGDLEGYRIAGARDVPDIEVQMWDVSNGGNNVGMMGLGEPPKVPTAGAIANAVYHALGARVRELPITPARVLAALEEAGR